MSLKFLPAILGLFPLASHASQAANFNISESVAAQYGCNSTCYTNFQEGLALDQVAYGSLYDEEFYATTDNFSTSVPGDLLKFAPINASTLSDIPAGITAYRFQHVTTDLSGEAVPATGFMAFPYANRTGGHLFRTIAYAHGTSGVFLGCAPSVMPNLYEYGSWSYLLERGYAVIATDYAGLGNNYTGHQYSASPAQANDLYYSIAAARQVFGQALTEEWASVGHSQGGGAVWALAESSLVQDDPLSVGAYLGTVPQAPGVSIGDMAMLAFESDSSDVTSSRGVLGELGWVAFGLKSIDPNASLSWILPAFQERLELAELAQACYDSMESLVADLTVDQVINLTDPSAAYALEVMQNLTARGMAASEQPVLVVQGLSDVSVLPEVVIDAYTQSCVTGNEVALHLYPGLDHTPVIPASAPEFLQWLDDRFDGIATSARCENITVQPFDEVNMYAPADED